MKTSNKKSFTHILLGTLFLLLVTFPFQLQSTSKASANGIDVWWPTDGAHISGTQPFKALLQDAATSEYQMYWQVDGGNLVPMQDSSQDYPHKEASVNVTGWSWHGSGPYAVMF